MFLRMHCAIYMYCKYKILALYNPQSNTRQHNFISFAFRIFPKLPLCEFMSLVNSRQVQYFYFFKDDLKKFLDHKNFVIPLKYHK